MNDSPQENIQYCRNCQHTLPEEALYCTFCGQKYTTGKVTLRALFREFLAEVFSLDSKIFKTAAYLFLPGKLTNEYFAGRHRRFVHPIRIFFITAVVFFALLSVVMTRNSDEFSGLSSVDDQLHEEAYRIKFMNDFDAAVDSTFLRFPKTTAIHAAVDTLRYFLYDPRQEKYAFNYFYLTDDWSIQDSSIQIDRGDMIRLPIDSFLSKYHIEGVFSQTLVRQEIRLQSNFDDFLRYLLGQMIWMVVLMMPVLALILKILYIRRNRYYIEHLIFSFHYHAFVFVVFSLGLLYVVWSFSGKDRIQMSGWLFGAITLGSYLYLFIAMRKVYRQGIIKTVMKYGMLNFMYIFVFILMLSLVSIVSAVMY